VTATSERISRGNRIIFHTFRHTVRNLSFSSKVHDFLSTNFMFRSKIAFPNIPSFIFQVTSERNRNKRILDLKYYTVSFLFFLDYFLSTFSIVRLIYPWKKVKLLWGNIITSAFFLLLRASRSKSILLLFPSRNPYGNVEITFYFRSFYTGEIATFSERTRQTIDCERGTIACKCR